GDEFAVGRNVRRAGEADWFLGGPDGGPQAEGAGEEEAAESGSHGRISEEQGQKAGTGSRRGARATRGRVAPRTPTRSSPISVYRSRAGIAKQKDGTLPVRGGL